MMIIFKWLETKGKLGLTEAARLRLAGNSQAFAT